MVFCSTLPYVRYYRIRLLLRVFGVEAYVRIRMQDLGVRYPAIDVPPETLPGHPVTLTPSSQCAQPVSRGFCLERVQSRYVA